MTRFCTFKMLATILLLTGSLLAQVQSAPLEDDQVNTNFLATRQHGSKKVSPHSFAGVSGHTRQGIPNIDSAPNFSGHFFAEGVDSAGNPQSKWYWNMVGNPPQMGGTTTINAPIVPLSLDLRNADGSPRFFNGHRLFFDVTPFVERVVNSPLFQNSPYSSSPVPTQFLDAVQRAEFTRQAKPDWHTILNPSVKTTRVIILNKGSYLFAPNPDGSCCFFVLVDFNTIFNKLFPTAPDDTNSALGAAINSGEVTTKDLTTFLLPNTFLLSPTFLFTGFHTYEFDDTDPNVEKRYLVNVSTWLDPGIFEPGFEDISTLTHELAETFNDPFVVTDGVHNLTPWWLAPNGNCGDTLEVGDGISFLPHQTFPININGFVYHPQNIALMQWFEREVPSSALHGSYSYPDEDVLTAPSARQNAGCQ